MIRRFVMETAKTILSPKDRIVQIVSTLAIENLYIDKETEKNLTLLANKKKSPEDVINELNKVYGL